MSRGIFITLEGVEGCGKSTQAARVAEYLKSKGWEVVSTREPGGVPIAETIRGVLLDPANRAMTATTELFLYEAARAQHVDECIRPALERGAAVVCDRFYDSTTAYQGGGRGMPMDVLARMHHLATAGLQPHRTIIIDVPAAVGLKRAIGEDGGDRMEQEALSFHDSVRQAFLAIAEQEPERFRVIDGERDPDAVFGDVRAAVDEAIGS